MQVTPSQRAFDSAHAHRVAKFFPGAVPPRRKRAVSRPLTPQDWFDTAWRLLDGPIIRVTIRDVQDAVCAHFDVPRIYMESARRTKSHYLPRSIAMFLCGRLTSKSATVIGRSFGGRDHTTILHNIRVIEKMLALQHPINKDVKAISKKLGVIA